MHATCMDVYAWQATQINTNSTVDVILLHSLADEDEDPLVGNIQGGSICRWLRSLLPGCWPPDPRLPCGWHLGHMRPWGCRLAPVADADLVTQGQMCMWAHTHRELFGSWWGSPSASDRSCGLVFRNTGVHTQTKVSIPLLRPLHLPSG